MTEIRRLLRGGRLMASLAAGLLVLMLVVSACMPTQPAPVAPMPEPAPVPLPELAPVPEAAFESIPETVVTPAPSAELEAELSIATAEPVLTILSPMQGATLLAGDIEFSVSVENFKVVALGGANAPGEGHLHFYMDVAVPTAQGVPAVTAAGTYKVSPTTMVVWESVLPGEHTFSVQLVNSDHTPLATPVFSTITVTVVGEAMEPAPLAEPALPSGGAYSY